MQGQEATPAPTNRPANAVTLENLIARMDELLRRPVMWYNHVPVEPELIKDIRKYVNHAGSTRSRDPATFIELQPGFVSESSQTSQPELATALLWTFNHLAYTLECIVILAGNLDRVRRTFGLADRNWTDYVKSTWDVDAVSEDWSYVRREIHDLTIDVKWAEWMAVEMLTTANAVVGEGRSLHTLLPVLHRVIWDKKLAFSKVEKELEELKVSRTKQEIKQEAELDRASARIVKLEEAVTQLMVQNGILESTIANLQQDVALYTGIIENLENGTEAHARLLIKRQLEVDNKTLQQKLEAVQQENESLKAQLRAMVQGRGENAGTGNVPQQHVGSADDSSDVDVDDEHGEGEDEDEASDAVGAEPARKKSRFGC